MFHISMLHTEQNKRITAENLTEGATEVHRHEFYAALFLLTNSPFITILGLQNFLFKSKIIIGHYTASFGQLGDTLRPGQVRYWTFLPENSNSLSIFTQCVS